MTNQVITGRGMNVITGTTVLGEVQNASEVMSSIGKIDTTSHNNVSAVKTSTTGFIENGELSIELGYSGQTAQDAILTAFYAGTVSTWMIVAPCAAISRAWSFSGYVCAAGTPKFDRNGTATLSFRVQPSGVITALTTQVTGPTAIAITDQDAGAITLSPTFAATTYGYSCTADKADTAVKVTITYVGAGESGYVNNTALATATPSDAITLPTADGAVYMIPCAFFKTACVPEVYWIEVSNGYV